MEKNKETASLSARYAAFNEEQTILTAISQVLKHSFINQLVIVNDGSTDKLLNYFQMLLIQESPLSIKIRIWGKEQRYALVFKIA